MSYKELRKYFYIPAPTNNQIQNQIPSIIMPTMQAWRLHSYGGPETLTLDTVEVPTPGPTQALVSVSYAGMNPFDWKIREGYIKDAMPLPLPYTLGVE